MVRELLVVAGVVSFCSMGSMVRAEPANAGAQGSKAAAGSPATQPLGVYGGVTEGGGDPPTHARPAGSVQLITWPGFTPSGEQGNDVFLQLTGEVPYSRRVHGKYVDVVLKRVKVALRNNLRRVDTRSFRGAVTGFKLTALSGHRVRLRIDLAQPVKPTISTTQREGFTYLVVSFPRVEGEPSRSGADGAGDAAIPSGS